MDLYYNKETKEYVIIDGKNVLVVTEKEFNEMRKFGMSGILLKLQREHAKARESSR